MDLKTVEHDVQEAARDIGAGVGKGAKSLFATITSAISSFLGLANPRWRQFAAEWRLWTWTKRMAFLAVARAIALVGVRYGVRVVDIAGGNLQAARAYAHGDVVTKAEVRAVQREAEQRQRQVEAYRSSVDALKQKVDALGEKFDSLTDSVRQLQLEMSAVEEARQPKSATKITTGAVPQKAAPLPKRKAISPSVWDQMKAVLP